MNLDDYLAKRFTTDYNCFSFVREVWLDLTGNDLGQQTPEAHTIKDYNDRALQVANTLTLLNEPISPSIVLFQRKRLEPHIGIYYNNRVLHLTRRGAYYMPLDQVSSGYTEVKFYK